VIPGASPEALDLLKQMLQLDPTKRPGAAQALQHLWFTGQSTPLIETPPTTPAASENRQKVDQAPRPPPAFVRSNSDAPTFDDIFDGID
jgi:serine/threonine protein kinase